jgi:hypothetical protein
VLQRESQGGFARTFDGADAHLPVAHRGVHIPGREERRLPTPVS